MAATNASSARRDVLEMLIEDHKKVKKMFRDFEKKNEQDDTEGCREIVERTCAELEVHATLEEELFYPAIRKAMKDKDLIDEAEVEHGSAKQLIAQLKKMESSDPKYAATFTVLGEYINHHVREEEGEIFPQLNRSTQVDWGSLSDQVIERKAELMQQHGLAEEDEEAGEGSEDREPVGARAGSRRSQLGGETRSTSPSARKGSGRSGNPAGRKTRNS